MKILITGGAGYIGSHISEVLIRNKKKVFIADNLSTGYKILINKKSKFFKTMEEVNPPPECPMHKSEEE